jgi:NAD(P)-dependent dehydrogenase (short-subunit alcohol dehydrogenase family)
VDGQKRFDGRTLMVTGGAGNIGLETARRLAREGARVALVDVAEEKLEQAAEELRGEGAEVRPYRCNVTDRAAVAQTVEQIVRDFGRIDLLFNNAGYQGLFQPTQRYPEEDFAAVININVNGFFYVLKAVSAHMVDAGGGAIVNTASMAGVEGPPNMAAYGASKFAVIGLTQTASKDLAPYGIRVNSISPAFMGPGYMWDRQVNLQAEAGSQYFSADPERVAEEMIGSVPMRRLGGIDEIPGAVAFLMSGDASYITGVNVPISGGIL